MPLKIVTVVGARPQFIKAAVVSRALRCHTELTEILVHTGQHYDTNMSGQFFSELEIPAPNYQLEAGSGKHGAQTGRMLTSIEDVILRESPDWVLVFGDTNSTLAGALAASKLHIPVAHVEAGLRSFNRRMPEEINRVITDHLSDLLFAPTHTAVANLAREGVIGEKVALTGDVMYDAALYYGEKAQARSKILSMLGVKPREYILATIHRAENTDDHARLEAIVNGLRVVAEKVPVVWPVHPRTRKLLPSSIFDVNSMRLIEPVGYLDMICLERNAAVVATDSGGVQKEAYFHRVPCVTIREQTEWVELVDMGWNRLCPVEDSNAMVAIILNSIGATGRACNVYGDGLATKRIASLLAGR